MISCQNTVLCVDDEINVQNSLKRLFRKEKFTFLTASSGIEALNLMQGKEVNVIIADQKMPAMSGTELMARVKEAYPDIIRIILTGYTDVDSISESVNKGHIYKFFLKPWNDQALVLEVRQALEQYDLIQANKVLHQKVQEQNLALQQINENLENMVKERTRELQIKNHALALSHAVLEDLPVPIIGVSAELLIVLINKAVQNDLKIENRMIGGFISDYLHVTVTEKIKESIASGIPETLNYTFSENCLKKIIITPLSGKFSEKGVILAIT